MFYHNLISWHLAPFTKPKPVIDTMCVILDFLLERTVDIKSDEMYIGQGWVDLRFMIDDKRQMERIDTWLREDLRFAIKGWDDVEIFAPNPLPGKEGELHVRLYGAAMTTVPQLADGV
jgi:hypothetical protein